MNMCLKGDTLPQQCKEACISSIHMNGNKQDCIHYNAIEYQRQKEEEQSRLRAERSGTENIFCLKQIIKKKCATNRSTHLMFIEPQKAYDNISTKKRWRFNKHTRYFYRITLKNECWRAFLTTVFGDKRIETGILHTANIDQNIGHGSS